MTTKKELAALSSEAPQPPLRRGRGLRLSQASKQARELASKSSSSPQAPTAPVHSAPVAQPSAELAAEPTVSAEPPRGSDSVVVEAAAAAVSIEPAAVLDPQPPTPEREKRKIQLRKDLLKQCKRIARAQDRKLYQVIESALEEYLERYGAHE